jgi:hypothetical protein
MDAQTDMKIRLDDSGAPTVRNGAVTWLDTSINIPPGAYGVDINCTMKNDVSFWLLLPHMHQWGEHITIDHTSSSNPGKRLFDLAWDPDYAFHPPLYSIDVSAPYVMKTGDSVKVHCDWNNTSGMNLTFGIEMCVAFGEAIDSQGIGNVDCDKGQWGTF